MRPAHAQFWLADGGPRAASEGLNRASSGSRRSGGCVLMVVVQLASSTWRGFSVCEPLGSVCQTLLHRHLREELKVL